MKVFSLSQSNVRLVKTYVDLQKQKEFDHKCVNMWPVKFIHFTIRIDLFLPL